MKTRTIRIHLILLAALLVVLANSCMPFNPFLAAGVGDLKIYWTNGNVIYQANLDGTGQETVFSEDAGAYIAGLVVDHGGGKLYYSEPMLSFKLYSINLDGTAKTTVANIDAVKLALDPFTGKLYMTSSGGSIYECGLDGSGLQNIYSSPFGNVADLALDDANNRLYWVDGGEIYRSAISNPLSPTQLTFTGSMVTSVALDVAGGKLYYGTSTGVYEAYLNAGSPSILQGSSGFANNLAVDAFAGKLYWSMGMMPDTIFEYDLVTSSRDEFVSSATDTYVDLCLDLWP